MLIIAGCLNMGGLGAHQEQSSRRKFGQSLAVSVGEGRGDRSLGAMRISVYVGI